MSSALNFAVGALLGGLVLSAAWGLLWLVVGAIGLWRRTCSWRVVANSVVIAVVPLLLAWALVRPRGAGIASRFRRASGRCLDAPRHRPADQRLAWKAPGLWWV
jgi:hypothetical protein